MDNVIYSYIIIGLPAYNEEGALPKLFDKLLFLRDVYGDKFRIIVVNDGSSDNTENILKEYKKCYGFVDYINHEGNQGLGRAIYTLFCYASQNYDKNDILVTLDADNTHNPNIIPKMVEKLIKEGLDVVIASRFAPGSKEIGLTIERKIYSRGAAAVLKKFFPISNVHDYSCGFRAYDIGYLDRAMEAYGGNLVTSKGFECMAEILARFSKIGVKAGEYPLVLEYNLKEGQSKMKVLNTIKGYFSLIHRVKKPTRKRGEVNE
ncbi:MAG: glycosyltransferase family 2 protein [Lutispora sp.]|nr:glycosyltransferase family 2 protein [Lutispora sp.]